MAKKHQAPPIGKEAKLTADIDLSILGRNEAEFEQYEASIRQEYHWVSEAIYRKARVKILESFLNRPTLFWTDLFRARYEVPARDNLRRLIYRLGGKPERA